MSAAKRPRFLLDLAEELIWLKDKAGTEVAEHWYAALVATVPSSDRSRPRRTFQVCIRL